jgi:hypothetical protein
MKKTRRKKSRDTVPLNQAWRRTVYSSVPMPALWPTHSNTLLKYATLTGVIKPIHCMYIFFNLALHVLEIFPLQK